MPTNTRTPALPLLALVGLSTGALALAARSGSENDLAMTSTHQPATNTHVATDATMLSVLGVGQVSLAPNRASVGIGVHAEARTAAEAMSLLNKSMVGVLDSVKGLNLPGQLVTTSGISLSPQYDYENQRGNRPRITGYIAHNNVSVRVDDPAAIGVVIDAATASGANEVNGVSFLLQDPESARRDAMRQAVAQARLKADTVADAMGMRVAQVVQVIEAGAAEPPRPMFARGMMMEAAAAAPTSVEPGQLDISASVTMIVRLEPLTP